MAFASGPEEKQDELSKCAFFRAKLERVLVYAEASTDARVIAQLSLGEKVCLIGEAKGFAIVDWSLQNSIGKQQRDMAVSQGVAFVRLVDLWEPQDVRGIKEYGVEGVLKRALQYYHYLRSGGVPEEAFFPFESLKQGFHSSSSEGH